MATTPLQELVGAAHGVLQDLDAFATGQARAGRLERLRKALLDIEKPIECDPCYCRKAVPGMWTSGYDATRKSFVRHGVEGCIEYVEYIPSPRILEKR